MKTCLFLADASGYTVDGCSLSKPVRTAVATDEGQVKRGRVKEATSRGKRHKDDKKRTERIAPSYVCVESAEADYRFEN